MLIKFCWVSWNLLVIFLSLPLSLRAKRVSFDQFKIVCGPRQQIITGLDYWKIKSVIHIGTQQRRIINLRKSGVRNEIIKIQFHRSKWKWTWWKFSYQSCTNFIWFGLLIFPFKGTVLLTNWKCKRGHLAHVPPRDAHPGGIQHRGGVWRQWGRNGHCYGCQLKGKAIPISHRKCRHLWSECQLAIKNCWH